ncbi:hypothetical protein LWI28_024047 [Acer negundo]|uniref:Uncharacterized protein n=1 Tax=Acer negundo TaxID=4023 RepID=A0AAD5P2U6_ACENE|nr:hypothetical protein LWI28_024047 [Acer negundo]
MQQLIPRQDDQIIRGINNRLETLAQNVTRVIDVVDGGGHQGDSDEVKSRMEGGQTVNPLREQRRLQQQTTHFIELNPGEHMNQQAPQRVASVTSSREEWDEILKSLFTEEIASAQVPNNFKMPPKDMCGFSGTGDPDDHLDLYLDWMNMQGASDAVKCKVFPLTLSGDARI